MQNPDDFLPANRVVVVDDGRIATLTVHPRWLPALLTHVFPAASVITSACIAWSFSDTFQYLSNQLLGVLTGLGLFAIGASFMHRLGALTIAIHRPANVLELAQGIGVFACKRRLSLEDIREVRWGLIRTQGSFRSVLCLMGVRESTQPNSASHQDSCREPVDDQTASAQRTPASAPPATQGGSTNFCVTLGQSASEAELSTLLAELKLLLSTEQVESRRNEIEDDRQPGQSRPRQPQGA